MVNYKSSFRENALKKFDSPLLPGPNPASACILALSMSSGCSGSSRMVSGRPRAARRESKDCSSLRACGEDRKREFDEEFGVFYHVFYYILSFS